MQLWRTGSLGHPVPSPCPPLLGGGPCALATSTLSRRRRAVCPACPAGHGEQLLLFVTLSRGPGCRAPRLPALPCGQDEKIQSREGKPAVDVRYEAACNRLASKAVQRGSADNVTVMAVRIGP